MSAVIAVRRRVAARVFGDLLAGSGAVAVVADGSPFWVDAVGWDHFDHTVGSQSEVPFALVDQVMVERAEQASVVEVGWSASAPRDPVMCLGLPRI